MKKSMLLKGSQIDGTITAIPSKSYAHRIAICNFLAGKKDVLKGGCDYASKDIAATKQCLIGLQTGNNRLDCGESGSTLRFIIPLSLCAFGEYEYIGHGKLMDRPNEELFECLRGVGIEIEKRGESIVSKGVLKPAEYKIGGDVSSQYISGLLMALPTLKGDSRITLTTPLVSSPYVDITIEVLNGYGIEIEKDDKGFVIKGNNRYVGDLQPEGDWSNAAFFLVLGAICGKISVTGLNLDSSQGDKVILDIIKSCGAAVEATKDSVTVKKASLNGFSFDAEECPDLVPVASVLAAFSCGVTTIKNIERLKIKESDRVTTTIAMLKALGIKAECKDNCLVIYGGTPIAGRVDSYNDHRIAMAASIAAMAIGGESIVDDYKAIDKSYPTFYDDLKKIGGIAYEIQ